MVIEAVAAAATRLPPVLRHYVMFCRAGFILLPARVTRYVDSPSRLPR